jgi:alpha-galactosidase
MKNLKSASLLLVALLSPLYPSPSRADWHPRAAECECGRLVFTSFEMAGDAPDGSIWLDNLDLNKMSSGWQKPLAGKSVEGNPLTLGGKVYPHGVGTHSTSQFAIDLNGAARFYAMIGVDDEKKGQGSVVFEVFTDGKLAFQSPPLAGGDAPLPVSIDLLDVNRMVLRVTDAGDGDDSDHADWAGAILTYPAGVVPAPQAVEIPAILAPPVKFDETPIAIAPASKPIAAPRINGPLLTGATPGRPFLFRIPATGEGPLVYSAKKLPAGLSLDSATGIITGSLQQAGTTRVQLTVKGAKGTTKRGLVVVGGADKLALTPPMGWNSWNIFYCDVDESKVRSATDWMLKTGLDRHGYATVNIDDCWQGERDAAGNIQTNPKFGDMKALGDYIHATGLKYGIYSSPGPLTCARHLGSWQHEAQDIRTYSSWGVDFLKYDWCSYGDIATGEGVERAKKPYRVMRDAIKAAPRDIVYSLCQYGMNDVGKWGNADDIKGNLWRTTGDIAPTYSSMMSIGLNQPRLSPDAGPGHWNDPDMLFMHALKPNEQITHLTIWSMLAAPLLIGSDISKLPQFSLDALSNDEMIAIDQDPLGQSATVVSKTSFTQVWSRPLWNGTTAVAFINRGVRKEPLEVLWKSLGLKGKQPVRDVWSQRDLGVKSDGLTADVPPHGALLFVIGKPRSGDYSPR